MLQNLDKEGVLEGMSVPFLLLQGQQDQICIPKGAATLHARASSTDKSIIYFDEGR